MTENNEEAQILCERLEPLALQRKQTDIPFLVIFIAYVGLMIFVADYAFTNGDVNINGNGTNGTQWDKSSDINDNPNNHAIDPTPVFAAKYIVLGFTFFPIFLNLMYIISSKLSARVSVIVLFQSIFFFVVFVGYMIVLSIPRDTTIGIILCVIGTILIILYQIIVPCLYNNIFYEELLKGSEFIQGITTFVLYLPNLLLVPIFQCILHGTMTLLSVFIMIYLSAVPNNENNMNFEIYINILHLINVFGFFWFIFFIHGFSKMVLSGNFTTWLWSKDEKIVPKFTMLRYVGIIIRYHLGSVAFGSLMAFVFSFLRILFKIFPKCCCHRAFLEKYEHFKKFHRCTDMYAYIMSIAHGTDFNQSANDVFNLRLTGDSVNEYRRSDILLLMGQFTIIGYSTLATFLYCSFAHVQNHVHYVAIASVVVSASGITWAFFTVVRVARDTLALTIYKVAENGSSGLTIFSSPKFDFVKNAWLKNANGDVSSGEESSGDEGTTSD